MRRPPKPVTLYIAQDLDPVTNLGKDIVIGIVIFRFIPHFPSSRAAATAELYCAVSRCRGGEGVGWRGWLAAAMRRAWLHDGGLPA